MTSPREPLRLAVLISGSGTTLQNFLDRIGRVESGITIRWFRSPAELAAFMKQDVAAWQAEIVRRARLPGRQPDKHQASGSSVCPRTDRRAATACCRILVV